MTDDPDLAKIRNRWEQALRQAVARLPELRFHARKGSGKQEQTIELVENANGDPLPESQSEASQRSQS
jgi:hypothetical protein